MSGQSTIVQLFEQQVQRTPDQLAVVFESQQLSYHALNQQANRLAGYLTAQGVKNDTLVGLCVERSVDMIVAMMAILKAGGAYVPLDPGYPQQRLNYMIEDSGIKLLLTQARLLNLIDATGIKTVTLDEQRFEGFADENPATPQDHSHNSLAYVIYTSGSTGQPKGVMVEHRGVVNLLSVFAAKKPVEGDFRALLWTSFSFDVSVYEIFDTLLFGGTLMVPNEALRLDSTLLFNWMAANDINHAYLPPFFLKDFQRWLEAGNKLGLQKLLVGVEPINEYLLFDLQSAVDGLTIINGYGPSETTICSTLYIVGNRAVDNSQTLAADRVTPIGLPVQNNSHYVLSKGHKLQPQGSVGELYIGGAGLARGYLNQPELTDQRFIANPFGEGRLYKTGDLVKY
ncbi:MAG: amino acid adenylation domain-containing protein, partial [Psychrosphaera sp.]|nr:amino acid adenylation domain-containing protein [Psychrosphaera sp.]